MKDGLSLQGWTAPAEFQFAMACKGFRGLRLVRGFKHQPAYYCWRNIWFENLACL